MKLLYKVLGMVLIILSFSSVLFADIPEQERQALIDFYNNTGGENWSFSCRKGWLGDTGTECNWYGVKCNTEEDHVIRIKCCCGRYHYYK